MLVGAARVDDHTRILVRILVKVGRAALEIDQRQIGQISDLEGIGTEGSGQRENLAVQRGLDGERAGRAAEL